jgi:hypothetical protein
MVVGRFVEVEKPRRLLRPSIPGNGKKGSGVSIY